MFGPLRSSFKGTLRDSVKQWTTIVRQCSSGKSLLKVDDANGVRYITMTDIKTRNSLSIDMVNCLTQAITEKSNDTSLRCIVLSAEGDIFSAGHNLKELAKPEGKLVFNTFSQLMLKMIQSPVPIVAAVDGLAAAAGCQLVAQTDFILCTKRSSFSTPGVNFGIFCSTPGVAVARALPRKVAAYMLFTGLPLSSKEALQYGMVQKVAEDKAALDEEVKQATCAIIAKSRSVVELGKKVLYKQVNLELEKAYEEATKAMVENLEMPDGVEGLKSFAEKRKPVWNH